MSNTISAYRVPPMMERKAAQELRENGSKAYLPRERSGRRTPIARGYIFTNYKPAFAKHVKGRVGECLRVDVLRLVPKLSRPARDENPFKAGDTAIRTIKTDTGPDIEIPVTVKSVSGRCCIIAHEMLGKIHTQSIHYTQLRPG